MVLLQKINNWSGCPCVVVASGPSLTKEMAEKIRQARWKAPWKTIVVNDAYKMMPWADVLYAADWGWWKVHDGAQKFTGERWTSHSLSISHCDDKSLVAGRYDLRFVKAKMGVGFSEEPDTINYGSPEHSGFQAVNLAMLSGCKRIVLVGFDYGFKEKSHFFGPHPEGLRNATDNDYKNMARAFDKVATNVEILNATPGSALTKFPMVDLSEALRWDSGVYRNGTVANAGSDRVSAA